MAMEFGKHITSAGLLALAVASGSAVAQGQQQSQAAGEREPVTSTDEMERLARQGIEVPEGKLDPEAVAAALGEQKPAPKPDDQQAGTQDSGASQSSAAAGAGAAGGADSTDEAAADQTTSDHSAGRIDSDN